MPESAQDLGNVAEACRQGGLDRTSLWEWKRRLQTQGFEELKDVPPTHKSHRQTTPPEVVEKIKALALAHPAYCCNRNEAMLAPEEIRLMEDGVGDTLAYHAFPDSHWIKLRTNNPLARIMREIRRRTRLVGAFPDGQSCLHLAAARLRHIAGTQRSTRRCMNMDPLRAVETEAHGAVVA